MSSGSFATLIGINLIFIAKRSMPNNEPPLILVKTWLALINSSEEKEVKDHAVNMLLSSFGNLEMVAAYCKKHGLEIK